MKYLIKKTDTFFDVLNNDINAQLKNDFSDINLPKNETKETKTLGKED